MPSQMSLRGIPDPLHVQVRIAYASAWNALIGTHTAQAVQFIGEFALRIAVLRGLQLYLQVAAVPEAMQEAVWVQALTSLDLAGLPRPIEIRTIKGWGLLRLDLVLKLRGDRKRYEERTIQLARLAGARSAEAVIATHVENVLGLARLLDGVLPVDRAAELYLTEFGLPLPMAQMVSQRVQARIVGDQLRAANDAPVDSDWTEPPYRTGVPEPAADASAWPPPAPASEGGRPRRPGAAPRMGAGESVA